MKNGVYLFIVTIIIAGCSNNKKPVSASTDTVSIHKLWKYDTVRSASPNPGLIGKHFLDLTNNDNPAFQL